MSDLQLFLFDDAQARSWFPFTLTRPAGELLFGTRTLRQRAEEVLRIKCRGHITAQGLSDFDEPDAAPVIQLSNIDSSKPRIFLSSRAVLAWGARAPRTPGPFLVDGKVAGYLCDAGQPNPAETQLLNPASADGDKVAGVMLEQVWELMTRNAAQNTADVEHLHTRARQSKPANVGLIGEVALIRGKNVTIEPNVVLDFSGGPIWLDDNVTLRAFTRLAGPSYVGVGTQLLGGAISAVSIGPACKVHGEIEQTVVLGYSNKAHDGFLGHAYVGRWVNLGAMTTNSDLKNNYGNVRLWTPEGEVDTGEMKIGCFLGDHVKTGIGALLNTGTVVGPGSNLFGTEQPPKFVPPFSWGSGLELTEYELEKFLETAETAMARRNIPLSDRQRRMLSAAWETGRKLESVP
jgi:UDP-N-acetylglucosamine diphosphorylase/glucosamine-1-phosphate N-acetyltransferase